MFISRNEVFWASFYDSVINAINHAPKEEHQSIYREAQKIIANNPKCNPTPFQLHIDQLVTVSDLSEQNKVLYTLIFNPFDQPLYYHTNADLI